MGVVRTGVYKTSEYKSWRSMMDRVFGSDPKHASYSNVEVCQRWQESSRAFIKDMGPKPTPKHTIDRIDNEKGYFPWNCRWATVIEQNRNKRNNVIKGTSIAALQEQHGLAWATVRARIAGGIPLDAPKYSIRNPNQVVGEDSNFAKLTEEKVRVILTSKLPAKEISLEMGVHVSLIYLIRARKIWKHVELRPYTHCKEN